MAFYVHENGDFKHILEPQELVDSVRQTLCYYQDEAMRAREKASKTREEVARGIKNEYAKENRLLNQKLKFSIASVSSEKELNDYNAFVEKHLVCRQTKATGGALPIISQYATGIGICTKLTCPVCGAEQDITDTSVW
jgi:hypothetical protein